MCPIGQPVGGNTLETLNNPTAGSGFPLCQPQDTLIGQHDVTSDVHHDITELVGVGEKRQTLKPAGMDR